LQPSNFLVHREPSGVLRLLLTDFATAAVFGRTHILHRVAFTPLYCAPELVSIPDDFTSAVDIWSLGVCLFILQTEGEMPFEDAEDIATGNYDASKIGDSLARDLCQRMLVVDPAKRLHIDAVMAHPYLLMLDEKLRHSES
jgi:serine/threonine protein kinase